MTELCENAGNREYYRNTPNCGAHLKKKKKRSSEQHHAGPPSDINKARILLNLDMADSLHKQIKNKTKNYSINKI